MEVRRLLVFHVQPSARRLFLVCGSALLGLVLALLVTVLGVGPTAVAAPVFNGDFEAGEAGWMRWAAPGSTGVEWNASGGTGNLTVTASGDFGWFQRVAVVPGEGYTLVGEWAGDVSNNSWAEILLFDCTEGMSDADIIARIDIGHAQDVIVRKDAGILNPPPVWDWEPIAQSPHPDGPGLDIHTSCGEIVLALKLGGSEGSRVSFDDLEFADRENQVDLSISKHVDPGGLLSAGQAITYTLIFTNSGPELATGVIITDTVPVSVTNTGVVSSGVAITQVVPGYVWNVQDLGAGQRGLITITGVLSDPLPVGASFTNTVIIATDDADADASDNRSAAGVTVAALVASVEPAANSHTASVSTSLTATVGGAVSQTTVSTETFAVHGGFQGHLAGGFGVPVGSGAITFDPAVEFHPGEFIQASVTSGVVAGGVPLGRPTVWQFRTAVPFGSGRFVDSGQNMGSENSLDVALGDLDGDRDLDAFVGNASNQPDRVWLNDGSGQFTVTAQSLGASNTYGVALGDVDSDGDLDAFVANRGQANTVWLNDGTGQFTVTAQSLGVSQSYDVALGDVDGDGDLDAFVADLTWPNTVWLNDGAGAFRDSGQRLGSANSEGVALGDVDGDGDLDAFVANWQQGDAVWLNDGTGVFQDSGQELGAAASHAVALGDVDGDGDLDAFVGTDLADLVWLNDGTGTFQDSGQDLDNSDSWSHDVALGDLDGDGDLDAFVTNPNSQPNRVWLNQGGAQRGTPGVFEDNGQSLGALSSKGVALGDVDGDGDLDAVVANDGHPNRLWWNLNRVDLSIAKTVSPRVAAPGQMVTYTLVYTSLGPQAAIGVQIADPMPGVLADVGYVSAGPAVTPTGAVSYTWHMRDLAPGDGGVITVTGTVSPFVSGVFSLTNRATITAAVVDVLADDNFSVVSSTVDADPPGLPALLSPADDAVISDTTPALTWEASPSPDVAGYLLDWDDVAIDVGDVTLYIPTFLIDGVYTWTVAAYDRVGNVGTYTDTWSFTVDATPPDSPALVSPADGLITSTTSLTLTWGTSVDAVGYLLHLDGAVLDVGAVITHATGVLADGVYTWTVVAYDALGNTSAPAEARAFVVDTVSPQILAVAPHIEATDAAIDAAVVITFSEPIDAGSLAYTITPDPGGWSTVWDEGGTVATLIHHPFAYLAGYTVTVTVADDLAGHPLAGAPVAWHFATAPYRVCLPLAVRNFP
jgi:uncharacterized repeat protein (TIGR01451 family)